MRKKFQHYIKKFHIKKRPRVQALGYFGVAWNPQRAKRDVPALRVLPENCITKFSPRQNTDTMRDTNLPSLSFLGSLGSTQI